MEYFKRTSTLFTLFTLGFLLLVLLKPGPGFSDFLLMYSAVSAVIFGIFIVFSVSNSHDRLNRVNELLKIEDANNLLLYKLSHAFGAKVQDELRGLLDLYLMDQIDYRLEDFTRSAKSFHDMYAFIISLEPQTKVHELIYEEMISILTLSSSNRIQIETITNQKLSRFEWISVWGLTFVVISQMYQMSHDDVFASISLTVLASASFLLVLVLRDLDNLKWQKDKWTWEPLHNLFTNMELMPYYPRVIFETGEAKAPYGVKIRVADYPDLYPIMTNKTVTTVEYHDPRSPK